MIKNNFANKKIITNEKIIDAPEGILILYEITNPRKAPTNPITIESRIMFLKFLVNRLAIDWGMVNREITNIIPTTLIFNTMVKATNAMST